MARKPRSWHVEDIKAELRKKFGPLAALSVAWGCSPNALSNTLGRPGYSVPLERRIAEALGQRPQDLWPDRFDIEGKPLSLRVDRRPTNPVNPAHRQNQDAA